MLSFLFQFLKHGSLNDIHLDDQADFKLTDSAMTSMGMSDDEKLAIYTVVAGVLHLGNICFEEDDKGQKGKYIYRYRKVVMCLYKMRQCYVKR